MRSALTRIAIITLAAATVGACGSSAPPASAPAPAPKPAKLALLAGSGGAGVAAAADAKAAIYPQRPTKYVLDGTLPDLGADAPVRRLVGHDVTAADLARLASALGLHGTAVRTETGYELHDGDAVLNIDTSSGVTFVDYSSSAGAAAVDGGGSASSPGSTGAGTSEPPDAPAVEVPPPTIAPPVDVPSADDAATIVQTLLDNLGVLDGQQWTHEVTDPNGAVSSCSAEPDSPQSCDAAPAPEIYSRTVTYQLLVDGVRVPGLDWSVTIGDHGRVEWVSGTWAATENAGAYPLQPTAKAYDDLVAGRGQYVGMQALAADAVAEVAPVDPESIPPLDVHVTGVALGFARWDGTENARPVAYLVPTYRWHAKVAGSDPYDIELLALTPGSFAITTPITPSTTGPTAGPIGVGENKNGAEPVPDSTPPAKPSDLPLATP